MNFNGQRTEHLSEFRIGDHLSEFQMKDHLSENQIEDHLIGDLEAATAAHLAACKFCESRVAEAAAPIQAFKAVTAAWSERRSATLPLHQTMARSARFHPRMAWVAVTAVMLAIGVTIPFAAHQQRQETAQTRTQAQSPASDRDGRDVASSDQIVRDNQMLKAIDRELDASVESREALGLKPIDTATQGKAEAPSPVQD